MLVFKFIEVLAFLFQGSRLSCIALSARLNHVLLKHFQVAVKIPAAFLAARLILQDHCLG